MDFGAEAGTMRRGSVLAVTEQSMRWGVDMKWVALIAALSPFWWIFLSLFRSAL